MNRLVDEELVSPQHASGMTEEEFNRALEDLFDRKFEQHFYHPEQMQEKSHGQRAEVLLVDFLGELDLGFRARLAPDAFDHGRQKADMELTFDGYDRPVFVQLTLQHGEQAEKKFARLPEDTIGVEVPLAVFGAEQTHDPKTIRNLGKEVLRQVIRGLATKPAYRFAYAAIAAHFLGSKAA